MMLLNRILYNLLRLVVLTVVSADEYVSDVDAPAYYKYDAKPGQFPWVVRFVTVEHCMGTLVHPSWVLTAAHCLEQSSDPSYYTLELTGDKGQVETASELHPYPRYHSSRTSRVRDHGNDIALMRVAKPFRQVPTLPMRQVPYVSDKYHRRPCHVLGFVKEVSGPQEELRTLQFTRAYARAFADCFKKSHGQDSAGLAMRHTVCAIGTGRRATQGCSGNPGGPLVCPVETVRWRNSTRTEVVGVSSWNQPGVYCGATSRYTDVGYFRDWLKATINGDDFVLPETLETKVQQSVDDKFPCSAGTTPTPRNYTMFFPLFVISYIII